MLSRGPPASCRTSPSVRALDRVLERLVGEVSELIHALLGRLLVDAIRLLRALQRHLAEDLPDPRGVLPADNVQALAGRDARGPHVEVPAGEEVLIDVHEEHALLLERPALAGVIVKTTGETRFVDLLTNSGEMRQALEPGCSEGEAGAGVLS